MHTKHMLETNRPTKPNRTKPNQLTKQTNIRTKPNQPTKPTKPNQPFGKRQIMADASESVPEGYLDTYLVGTCMPDEHLMPKNALVVCIADDLLDAWKQLPNSQVVVSHASTPAYSDLSKIESVVFDVRASSKDRTVNQSDTWMTAKEMLYTWFLATSPALPDLENLHPVLMVCTESQLGCLRDFFDGRLMRKPQIVFQ